MMPNRRATPHLGSGAPLYVQIVKKLSDQIAAGAFGPGNMLPSEAALTRTFGVSRVTVRQSLAELERTGLIYRQQGRGTFINTPALRQKFSQEAETIVEALQREGVEPEIKILALEHVRPDPEVAAMMGTGEQAVARLSRLYLHNRLPIALSRLHLPLSLGGVAHILSQQSSPGQTTYTIFDAMGLAIKEARHVIKAVAIDAETAERLHLKVGDTCLAADRITYSSKGSVLEATQFVYPPEGMRFEITLPRSSSARVLKIHSKGGVARAHPDQAPAAAPPRKAAFSTSARK